MGSVLYFGSELTFKSLREFAVKISLGFLVLMEILSYISSKRSQENKNTKIADRSRQILSRIFYGAMYTVVIYQAGTLLGNYKSCDKDDYFSFNRSVCVHKEIPVPNVADEIYITFEHTKFDITMIVVTFIVFLWSFWGSIHYTLYEKNSSSPAFMWDPVYDAIRYTVKTYIAGVSSVCKNYNILTMAVCFSGFSISVLPHLSNAAVQRTGEGGK